MIESEFNWAMRIKQNVENTSDLHIPPDITFKFEDDENEIHAHKWMMGMVSPVFNKMFFVADTKDKDAKELLIKGTTFEAFNITRNAIYGIASMENGLKCKSVHEVFSVLDLVTRYQFLELQQVVRSHLDSFPFTDDTILEVAATAMEKSSTFEDEAQKLLILCAKILKPKLENTQAVFEYVAAHRDDIEIVHELLALMKDIGPIASPVCANCRREPGQHGADSEGGQFREGLGVKSYLGRPEKGPLSPEEQEMLGKLKMLIEKKDKLQWLKKEQKLVDLDILIRTALHMERPEPQTCIDALEELKNLVIDPFMLKKQPEIVTTIRRLKRYAGPQDKVLRDQMMQHIEDISLKADQIYKKFKSLFTHQEGKRNFEKEFDIMVQEFKKKTDGMEEIRILSMTKDPTAEPVD